MTCGVFRGYYIAPVGLCDFLCPPTLQNLLLLTPHTHCLQYFTLPVYDFVALDVMSVVPRRLYTREWEGWAFKVTNWRHNKFAGNYANATCILVP